MKMTIPSIVVKVDAANCWLFGSKFGKHQQKDKGHRIKVTGWK
jgi:hypothetical protein